jgi:membrane-associated protein
MAGVGRMRFWVYALYSIIGGVLWTDGMLVLGHQLGKIKWVQQHKGWVDYAIVLVVILALVPTAVHYVLARRQRSTS